MIKNDANTRWTRTRSNIMVYLDTALTETILNSFFPLSGGQDTPKPTRTLVSVVFADVDCQRR